MSSSAVFRGAILNSHQYSIGTSERAYVLCGKVKSMIQQADEGHPGTGKHLSGLISSTLEWDGTQLFEHVTINVFPPKNPNNNLVFKSFSRHFLRAPDL